jgi:hypothetical protein
VRKNNELCLPGEQYLAYDVSAYSARDIQF